MYMRFIFHPLRKLSGYLVSENRPAEEYISSPIGGVSPERELCHGPSAVETPLISFC